MLDPRVFTTAQLENADEIFEEFRHRRMLPANEAWQDEKPAKRSTRAILIDLLDLPEDVFAAACPAAAAMVRGNRQCMAEKARRLSASPCQRNVQIPDNNGS